MLGIIVIMVLGRGFAFGYLDLWGRLLNEMATHVHEFWQLRVSFCNQAGARNTYLEFWGRPRLAHIETDRLAERTVQ